LIVATSKLIGLNTLKSEVYKLIIILIRSLVFQNEHKTIVK